MKITEYVCQGGAFYNKTTEIYECCIRPILSLYQIVFIFQ